MKTIKNILLLVMGAFVVIPAILLTYFYAVNLQALEYAKRIIK